MKLSTKDLAAQWKFDRKDAAKKLRLILEGKTKCDDNGRAALACLIEYFDPTRTKVACVAPNNVFGDYAARCAYCGYFFCSCKG